MLEQHDLWISGTGGYNTYRIPALAVTDAGTVLAFCEGRKFSHHDAGVIDLLVRRSADGGRTWSDAQLVASEPHASCANPVPIVDRTTSAVWLVFNKNRALLTQEERASKRLLDRQVWAARSADDGRTWTKPVDITPADKPPEWLWYSTGPGHGLQLSAGRLIAPARHSLGRNARVAEDDRDRKVGRDSRSGGNGEHDVAQSSHVLYSDNHGATWQSGGSVPTEGTSECIALETSDGALYFNCRDKSGRRQRVAALSHDGGLSFAECWRDEALIEPPCQATVIRLTDSRRHDRDRVLFCNPASHRRETLTVRLSYDECRTWPVSRVLEPGIAAYSDLAVLDDGTILCLYERGVTSYRDGLRLDRFDLEWLTDGADRIGRS